MSGTLQNYLNWNTWLLWGFGGIGVCAIIAACLWERFGAKPEQAGPQQKQKPRQANGEELPQPLQAWLRQALGGVPGYEERDQLRGELTAHLQETMAQFTGQGLPEAEAVARTLENLGSPEAFVESWHRENDKPLPWRFFLGASAGMFALGAGLLARFILQVQVMFAAPEPGHQGGELAELLPQALARGDQNAALGRLGTGAVLWLLLGTVLLVQGLRGRKRAKEEGQAEDV